MIFVTLGTQDKSFSRLLKMVDDSNIDDEIIVQAGYTKYKPKKKMKLFDYVSTDEFESYVRNCELLITHGGVGSIMAGIKYDKKIIACPRLLKYKEHTNDHQLDIVKEFEDDNLILVLHDGDKLDDLMKKTFITQRYKSNTKNMIKLISDFIDNN